MSFRKEKGISRRDFVRLGTIGLAAVGAGCTLGPGGEHAIPPPTFPPPPPPVAPPPPIQLRLGLQSYSLRAFKFDDVVAKTKDLGLHYIEFFGAHFPMGMKPEELAATQAKLAAAEIKVDAYGVVGIGKDEGGIRTMFEFAKKAGFDVYTANPDPAGFDLLDKLCPEYGVKVAIHNHGPGDKRWGRLQQMLDGLKDRNPNLGVCLDTGHLIRAGDDVIDGVRKLGPRLLAFHFKDCNEQNSDVVVGKGKTDLVAFFTAVRDVKFNGPFALEYEIDASNPLPGIAESCKAINEAVAKVV